MACLHGKAASYNLLEGIYANAVAHEVERLCVDSCNGCQVGHPSRRQHDCLMMNENERRQMYGLQAIERVNGKRMVWNEFAEAMRVLKLAVDRDLLEHLQQLEKYPDSTFVDSLMELHQNTENHELQCILNYLFHWRLEDPLESVAETFFRTHRVRTVVIHFAIKICFYQICGCYMRCYVLSLISDAWVHAYINVQHLCTPIRWVG
jgi:hypothetical protein